MIRFGLTVLLSTFGATTAFAQATCPTQADLVAGVDLGFADGVTETYRSTGPGTIVVEATDGAELLFRLDLAQGTHLLSYVGYWDGVIDAPSRQEYDYGMAPTDLPVPVAGERFNVEVAVTGAEGRVRQEDQLQAYAVGEPLVAGGCSYETIDVYIAYDTADNYLEFVRYMPQLGFGFLAWSEADDGRTGETIVTSVSTSK